MNNITVIVRNSVHISTVSLSKIVSIVLFILLGTYSSFITYTVGPTGYMYIINKG